MITQKTCCHECKMLVWFIMTFEFVNRCYLDPQNSGVKLSHLNKDGILELVLDGTEGPRSSRSERRISNQVGLKENYFRFHSHEGHVRLLLDALLDSKWDFFKMNYVILWFFCFNITTHRFSLSWIMRADTSIPLEATFNSVYLIGITLRILCGFEIYNTRVLYSRHFVNETHESF